MGIAAAGCTQKEQAPASGEATEAASAAPEAIAPTTSSNPKVTGGFVTFQFTDVAMTTSGSPVLRLGFDVKNGGKDPLLCDESGFSLQLADGSTLSPDAGAENTCSPDSIDPNTTAKAVIFFDLPSGYTGPVTVVMRNSDNSIAGRGTTQVH
jgi:hypothetical protein